MYTNEVFTEIIKSNSSGVNNLKLTLFRIDSDMVGRMVNLSCRVINTKSNENMVIEYQVGACYIGTIPVCHTEMKCYC